MQKSATSAALGASVSVTDGTSIHSHVGAKSNDAIFEANEAVDVTCVSACSKMKRVKKNTAWEVFCPLAVR